MGRLIEDTALMDAIRAALRADQDDMSAMLCDGIETVVLKYVPTVDAVPVRHGHWERGLDKDGDWISACSVCGEVALYDKADDAYLHTLFCPWCGARMDGTQ